MEKKVTYWQKVPVFKKDENGRRSEFKLAPCEAKVLGESIPVCIVCNEPEQGHGKRGRRHGFTPNSNVGLSLRVTYVGNPGAGQAVELRNVQKGKEANCYTEAK